MPRSLKILCDSALGDSEETYVKLIQALPIGCWQTFYLNPVGIAEITFFVHRCYAGVAVVGRIAEDDENGVRLLDGFGSIAFFGKRRKAESGLRVSSGNPSGEGVGEKNLGALRGRERGAGVFEKLRDLKVRDDERRGHDLEAEDAGGGGAAEVGTDEGVVVSCLLAQGALDAVEDFDEVGSGAAARVEHLHVGAGETEGFVKFGAQEMVDALDHVADDFARGVPDAEFLAQLGIEGFKEGLVEVLDGVFLTEGCEEVPLHTVEGVGGVVEDFGDLDGVQRSGFGDGVKEGAENGDAEVLGGETPVEDSVVRRIVGRAAPENPGGEDAVEECLDEGGAEEVLALFSFEGDAERLLQGGLNAVEGDDGMLGGAFACFACVGGKEFGDVLWLFERNLAREDAGEEIREGLGVAFGELGDREVPEVVGGAGEIVTFHHGRSAVAEFDELELVIVGDEAETVFPQVAADLLGLGERGETLAGRL